MSLIICTLTHFYTLDLVHVTHYVLSGQFPLTGRRDCLTSNSGPRTDSSRKPMSKGPYITCIYSIHIDTHTHPSLLSPSIPPSIINSISVHHRQERLLELRLHSADQIQHETDEQRSAIHRSFHYIYHAQLAYMQDLLNYIVEIICPVWRCVPYPQLLTIQTTQCIMVYMFTLQPLLVLINTGTTGCKT